MLDFVSFAQSVGVYTVLNHQTLGQIETNEFRSGPAGRPLSVLETMQTITDCVWGRSWTAGRTSCAPCAAACSAPT